MKVHLFPDPILNTKMVKIPPLDDHFQHWVTEMFELMYKSRGIGLAAPQVGLHYRFFLMDVAEETEEERKTEQKNEAQGEGGENLEEEEDFEEEDLEPLLPKNPKVILDPSVIFAHKETAVLEEGCLSIPKIKIEIERPSKIDVCYQNLQGERVEESLTGLAAACFQHELDHLDGILIWDRISPLHRKVLKKKFLNQQKNYGT